MRTLVDTSVLIDVLRGRPEAVQIVRRAVSGGSLHASEITRIEVLAGMRPEEEDCTRALLGALEWHSVDERIAEDAGALGQRWWASHSGIDAADLAVAATAMHLDADLLTRNVRHFPMFPNLESPY